MPRSEASKQQMREYDILRNKDLKRKEQNAAWFRKKRAEDSEFKAKAYAATAKWVQEHKEENNKYRAEWAKDDRDAHREQYAAYEFAAKMKKYNTTVEWYKNKLIEQLGLCALCGHLNYSRTGNALHSLQVDHSHDCCDIKAKSCGKCLRGLLCEKCNLRLSTVEDVLKEGTIVPNVGTWLSKALYYLNVYAGPRPVHDTLETQEKT